MASHFDVAERIESGIGNDGRLHVEVHYHGGKLPQWTVQPMDEAAEHANGRLPVVVLNQKGHSVDGCLVLMSMCDFEALLHDHYATTAVADAQRRASNGDAEAADWLRLMRPDEAG